MAKQSNTNTERETQRQIVDLLRGAGWLVFVTSQPAMARLQLSGLPDLVAFKHGVTLLIEVKSDSGKLRPSQAEFFSRLSEHLGPCLRHLVARRIDDVTTVLDGIASQLDRARV